MSGTSIRQGDRVRIVSVEKMKAWSEDALYFALFGFGGGASHKAYYRNLDCLIGETGSVLSVNKYSDHEVCFVYLDIDRAWIERQKKEQGDLQGFAKHLAFTIPQVKIESECLLRETELKVSFQTVLDTLPPLSGITPDTPISDILKRGFATSYCGEPYCKGEYVIYLENRLVMARQRWSDGKIPDYCLRDYGIKTGNVMIIVYNTALNP